MTFTHPSWVPVKVALSIHRITANEATDADWREIAVLPWADLERYLNGVFDANHHATGAAERKAELQWFYKQLSGGN